MRVDRKIREFRNWRLRAVIVNITTNEIIVTALQRSYTIDFVRDREVLEARAFAQIDRIARMFASGDPLHS